MTDYALSASSKEDMYAAYQQVGVLTQDENGEPLVMQSGNFSNGGGWALNDWGYVNSVYWCVLRWNGDSPTPPLPASVSIAWRSDVEEPGDYPEGVPRFA